jgi:argininosuccinate lyase
MPGYTHLQHAQAVPLAHHLLAYFWMLQRDRERLADCYRRTDVMPLGSGAIAGTSFPIDRFFTAQELGFSRISENSMDAVSDRDFVVEFLSAGAILGMHLSRLAEEIVIWNTREFGFVELDDAIATGSSLMPQKKNPDVAELVRGKMGRLLGNLVSMLTTLKGLPLTYNKDLQEDKEPLFDTVDTLLMCIPVMKLLIETMTFNKDRMAAGVEGDFSNATDLADLLVRRGVPFRTAHEIVGRLVGCCIQNGKSIADLTDEELHSFSEYFAHDMMVGGAKQSAEARDIPGGTSTERLEAQISQARGAIETDLIPKGR